MGCSYSLIVLWISHLNSAPHTSWLTMWNKRGGKKIKLLLFLQHSRWIEETSAMCTVCTIHLSNFLLLTPSFPLCLYPQPPRPPTLWLNTLHCIPHVDSQEKLSPAHQSYAIIWLFRGEWWCCVRLRDVCMCVCGWPAIPLSLLNWLAWQQREQTLISCARLEALHGLLSLSQINKCCRSNAATVRQ